MDIIVVISFVAGLILLIAGGELLVRGASRLAGSWGVSPLVIGLTVVAFGTSAPELSVSVVSSMGGKGDIAAGNAVGSNIVNVLFILGVASLITPMTVSRQLIRWDVPVMIGASVLAYGFALDGMLSTVDGLILSAMLIVYTVWSVRLGRKEAAAMEASLPSGTDKPGPAWRQLFFIVAGLGMLVLGSQWLVDSAIVVARLFGVSELIVGLTIVALGTSLPEVATSVIASIRGQRDIAVGNIVGSNIFNILFVLGSASVVVDPGIPAAPALVSFDFPVMIAVSLACLPVFFTGGSIDRWEGALFLAYYIAYTAYLILDSTGHDALPAFSAVMLWFALPLTAVTLSVVTVRFVKKTRS